MYLPTDARAVLGAVRAGSLHVRLVDAADQQVVSNMTAVTGILFIFTLVLVLHPLPDRCMARQHPKCCVQKHTLCWSPSSCGLAH